MDERENVAEQCEDYLRSTDLWTGLGMRLSWAGFDKAQSIAISEIVEGWMTDQGINPLESRPE